MCVMVNFDQRLLQQRLHDDIILRLAQFVSINILIASLLGHCYAQQKTYKLTTYKLTKLFFKWYMNV